jgi:hypothetical protein
MLSHDFALARTYQNYQRVRSETNVCMHDAETGKRARNVCTYAAAEVVTVKTKNVSLSKAKPSSYSLGTRIAVILYRCTKGLGQRSRL